MKKQAIEYRTRDQTSGIGQRLVAAAVHPVTITAGLLALSILLLTLAFAPVGQFYLAWVGLVPWLLALHRMRSQKAAFFWNWLAGTLFFTANMWWMYAISVFGLIGLMAYCGVFWGFAALIIRGTRLLEPTRVAVLPTRAGSGGGTVSVLLIAAVWTALEWVRGNLFTGLPWLYIGHTQTPMLSMCQVADILGAYGVTFWVVLVNALIALLILRPKLKPLVPATVLVVLFLAWTMAYGLYRMAETTTTPGPMVVVIQSNYPQSNTGQKGAKLEDLIQFHVDETHKAIAQIGADKVNLVVWSETMMPELNHQTPDELLRYGWIGDYIGNYAHFLEKLRSKLSSLAADNHVGLLTGGSYHAKFKLGMRDGQQLPIPTESRNSAYFFRPDGTMSDAPGQRYDKIHLVPWGEFIPFKYSIPFLYKVSLKLGPDYYSDYELQDGSDNGLTVFTLDDKTGKPRWRFVTPICFEDIDSRICSAMFRPGSDGKKRADIIINITNDGWFAANENIEHMQAATFRSIENRVPSARSVNTGISGFIDSVGRTSNLLPAQVAGYSELELKLDSRLTFYTRYGDVFAVICMAAAGLTAAGGMARWWRERKIKRKNDPAEAGRVGP